MKKIKELWIKYKPLISGVSGVIFAGLIAFIGYERGFKKSDKKRKKAEIDSLKSKVEVKIMEEKLVS